MPSPVIFVIVIVSRTIRENSPTVEDRGSDAERTPIVEDRGSDAERGVDVSANAKLRAGSTGRGLGPVLARRGLTSGRSGGPTVGIFGFRATTTGRRMSPDADTTKGGKEEEGRYCSIHSCAQGYSTDLFAAVFWPP